MTAREIATRFVYTHLSTFIDIENNIQKWYWIDKITDMLEECEENAWNAARKTDKDIKNWRSLS